MCTRTRSVGAVDLGDLKSDTAERLSRDAAAAVLPCTHRGVHSSLSLSPVTYCHTGAAACIPPPLRPPRSTLVSAAHVTTMARSWPSAQAADCLHRRRRRRARGPTSGSRMPPTSWFPPLTLPVPRARLRLLVFRTERSPNSSARPLYNPCFSCIFSWVSLLSLGVSKII